MLVFFLSFVVCAAEEVILDRQAFLEQAFSDLGTSGEMQTLWLDNELKQTFLQKLDYRIQSLRIRYWFHGERTAWILEEIGKERPITLGVVVDKGKIRDVEVLVYRESRGGEIRYNFFTRQFVGAEIKERKSHYKLNKPVDGITGATLSVRAVKKVATLALFLHRLTQHGIDEAQEEPE